IDHGRVPMPIGRRSVAPQHYLVTWTNGHALGSATVRDRNREVLLDLRLGRQGGLRINHRCHAAAVTGVAVHWNVYIKLSCLRTPPALLETAGGGHSAILTVELQLDNHLMGRGRDEGDVGRILSRA